MLTCAGHGNPGLAFSDDIVPANGWSGDLGLEMVTGMLVRRNNFWSTGPTGAHSGPDYLFFESSTGGLDTATAVTPMIDLTAALSDAELTFWMHAYGVCDWNFRCWCFYKCNWSIYRVYHTGAVQTPS